MKVYKWVSAHIYPSSTPVASTLTLRHPRPSQTPRPSKVTPAKSTQSVALPEVLSLSKSPTL